MLNMPIQSNYYRTTILVTTKSYLLTNLSVFQSDTKSPNASLTAIKICITEVDTITRNYNSPAPHSIMWIAKSLESLAQEETHSHLSDDKIHVLKVLTIYSNFHLINFVIMAFV